MSTSIETVLVLGAAGKTGSLVVEQLLAAGYKVVAFVHHPEKYGVPAGVTVFGGDASSSLDLTRAVVGCDAVLSALGHTSPALSTALTDAARTLGAALPTGARFISLTGIGVPDAKDPAVPLTGKLMTQVIKMIPGKMYQDGYDHATVLRDSQLDWTIIRAPRLTSGAAHGYELGYFQLGGLDAVARQDVASAMVAALQSGDWSRQSPMIRTRVK